MNELPVLQVIRRCDRSMTSRDYDALMQHYAEGASLMIKPRLTVTGKAAMRRAFKAIVQDKRVVEQGRMAVIERGKTALVIMETVLRYPCQQENHVETTRRATYVFRRDSDGQWRCTVDSACCPGMKPPVRM
ncbi:DUF4440 domain-containing protein [Pantoea stewartii]|uniref:YybH family protein n=1 Tax=Pantoea stewartii TaxID=66269 RepID=UPI00345C5625